MTVLFLLGLWSFRGPLHALFRGGAGHWAGGLIFLLAGLYLLTG